MLQRRPVDPVTVAALTVAVVGLSIAAPVIAYAAAPGLAIALWRNAIAAGLLAPVAVLGRRTELVGLLRGRTGLASGVAGVALAVHFGTWVPSVKLTTVAAATALVATQPVWQGLIARAQGHRLPPRVWLGIALAVAGAAAATGADLTGSVRAVAGDLLAVLAGFAGAVYTAAGERVRVSTSTVSYTTVCYGVCTVVLLAACLIGRVPLTGYQVSAWLAIVALVVGPQLLGHTMFSYALRRVSATTISVLYLLEVPGAALLGWLWLGQLPPSSSWPGLLLIVAGVAIVIVGGRGSATAEPRPPTTVT